MSRTRKHSGKMKTGPRSNKRVYQKHETRKLRQVTKNVDMENPVLIKDIYQKHFW